MPPCFTVPRPKPHASFTAPRPRPRASLGFTLLEIMVALAVTGIVLSALFGVYSTVMDAAERVQGRAEVVHTARLGLARLAKDLGSVHAASNSSQNEAAPEETTAPSWTAFQGRSPVLPLTEDNATILAFPTSSGLDFSGVFPGQTLYRVSYTLVRSGSEENLYNLRRRQVPLPYLLGEGLEEEPAGSAITVIEGIGKIALNFFPKGESLSREEWGGLEFGQSEDGASFPESVRVRLLLQDRRGQEHRLVLTRVLTN